MAATAAPKTMFEKIWGSHVVVDRPDGYTLLYVDRHLIHDGSYFAFQRLKNRGLKLRRVALGLTQAGLADRLGVTYQQMHKYEAGANRITAGRLHAVAEALGVGMGHFYEGLQAPDWPGTAQRDRAGLALARSFLAIADRRHYQRNPK